MGKIHCDICKKKCKGDVLKLDKKFMHKNCFNCTECGSSLDEGGFYCRDSRYYCAKDYQNKFGVKCGICNKFVDGEVVIILGGTFHIQCFQCQLCHTPLNCGDKATLWDELYLCDKCSHMKEKENISPTNIDDLSHGMKSLEVVIVPQTNGTGNHSNQLMTVPPAVIHGGFIDSSDTDGDNIGRHNDMLRLHLDNGYTSTDSGVEKTKSEIAYMSQHSPEYSMTSGDESWIHSSRHRKNKCNPYQFGKYYNESYLKIQERTEKLNPPRSNYATKNFNSYSESRNQQFHRPNNFSYRSSPNIHSRKGMSLLVNGSSHQNNNRHFHKSQSLSATSPSAGNLTTVTSASPQHQNYHSQSTADRPQSISDLSITQEYVKRLAHFPNAIEPDETYQPPIDRLDFPAPPSANVVWQDRKRAARLSMATVNDDSRQHKVQSTGDISLFTTTSESEDDVVRRQKRQRQINELRLMRNRSGMSQSLLDELEETTEKEKDSSHHLTVDPVSASRSPDASTEPRQRPRFDRHTFTSPSRDSRFEGRPAHSLSYRINYSSTGGRMGHLSGYNSTMPAGLSAALNRGYMSCVEDTRLHDNKAHTDSSSLSLRALSLPRNAIPSTQPHQQQSCDMANMVPHTSPLNSPNQSSALPSGYMNGHRMSPSMTTSGYSMDATTRSIDESTLIGGSGIIHPIGSGVTQHRSYMGPSAISAGRHHHSHHQHHSHHHQQPRSAAGVAGGYMSDYMPSGDGITQHNRSDCFFYESDNEAAATAAILRSQYPTVQSYLKPSSFLRSKEKVPPQIYPYEELKISNFTLPKGVDREQLETYLSDDDFQLVFHMTKSTFKKLPEWKRNDLKRKVDLY